MATTEVQFSPEDLKAAQSAERIPEPTVVVIFGASGSGASGSSTMSARLFVPAGAPLQASGGEVSLPSQV